MISKEDVQNLAELARLKLGDKEIESLQKDISSILDYVGHVSSVEDGGDKYKKPAVSVIRNVMRKDAARPSSDIVAGKEESLRAAFPKREGNYNVVRKIIQKDE